jgi:trk system potassium uptake protein TrkA
VIGRTIDSLKHPTGTNIGAIVRDDEVLIAHSDTKILTEDHVVLFLVNKRYISDVEKLFYVDPLQFF